jgi:hypothetical protein
MGVLTQRARDKLNTPQWKSRWDLFVQVSEAVLETSPDAQGDLAGSYLKFTTDPHPTSAAYAVVWLKLSAPKRLIVGLTLPKDFEAAGLGPSLELIFYQGLTRFLVIEEGQAVPKELTEWAQLAYAEVLSPDGLQ